MGSSEEEKDLFSSPTQRATTPQRSSTYTGTSPLLYLVDSVRASKHTEVGWPALHFRGCSVYHRRNELASCVDIIDADGQPHVIFMCV